MKITIIGTGYVGLVTGTCLAECGHDVVCVDIDAAKIDRLRRAEIPIYEPGLDVMVARNLENGRLTFTTDTGTAAATSEVIFLAVGTPSGAGGAADLRYLFAAAEAVAAAVTGPTIIVVKSTVPVGTSRKILNLVQARAAHACEVVSNPEFLKEGAAIDDFMTPDRIVVGCQSEHARDVMSRVYQPFVRADGPLIFMNIESAEMTKYAANAFLATKISFMNEMSRLCQATSADIEIVRQGISFDRRIGSAFMYAGVGYGGSCFPKDIRALIALGLERNLDMSILKAVDEVNEAQKLALMEILGRVMPEPEGKIVAMWGLAFKPNTDDIRDAPAIQMLEALLKLGVKVRTTDPAAIRNTRDLFGDRIEYSDDPLATVEGADALLLVTEWPEFRSPNFLRIRSTMRRPLVLDGRNIYDPSMMRDLGFEYHSIGRPPVSRPASAHAHAHGHAHAAPVSGGETARLSSVAS